MDYPDLTFPSADRLQEIESADFHQLKLRYLELTSLFEMNRLLNSTLELRTILNNVLLIPMGRLMISRGIVLLREGDEETVTVRNAKGIPGLKAGTKLGWKSWPLRYFRLSEENLPLNEEEIRFFQKIGAEIVLPLTNGPRVLGFLAFGARSPQRTFGEEDIRFLASVADLASIAVYKSLLFEELQASNKQLDRKVQQLNTIFEISRELNTHLDEDQVAQILAFSLMGELVVNRCIVLLKKDGGWEPVISKGLVGDVAHKLDDVCRQALPAAFLQKPSWIDLRHVDLPELSPFKSCFIEEGIYYLIPLYGKEGLVGIVGISNRVDGGELDREALEFAHLLANEAVIGIENAFLVQQMLEKQRMEDELRIARDIQAQLLPQNLPEVPGLEMVGANIPSKEVGGDYYDCIPLDNNHWGLAIADVSGKGVPAALLMANLQASLRTLALGKHSPQETVAQVNRIIFENTSPERFITCFYGVYEDTSRQLTYVNAGHNPPLWVKSSGKVEHLRGGGIILGLFAETDYEAITIQMSQGDLILFYTDGIVEATSASGEEYGVEALTDFLVSRRHLPLQKLKEELIREVAEFAARGDPFEDDLTFLLIRCK
jgi:sigma-B regulation protein RsbU (phosphoserine phosphatase)